MKQDFTSINVVIDQSGSMFSLASDTVGNFNKFLEEQKAEPGEATLTLCLFSDKPKIVHDAIALKDMPNLTLKTYRPSGNTALLDAIGTTVNTVGEKLAAMQEDDRPSKVIFLIITDGQENVSKEFTRDKIKEMVTHQQDVYSWQFVFMGANIDSFSVGGSLGMSVNNTMNYTPSAAGTKDLYKSISDNMKTYRSASTSSKADFFPTIKSSK